MQYFKTSITIKKISLASLFIVLSIILTRVLSFYVPIMAVPSLRIGLGTIPIIISGIVLGPIYGSLVGIIADVVGLFMFPNGYPYFFGYSLNSLLQGLIPGLFVFVNNKSKKKQLLNYLFPTLLIGTSIFFMTFICLQENLKLSKQISIELNTLNKIMFCLGIVGLLAIFAFLVFLLNKKLKYKGKFSFLFLSNIVFFNELFIVVLLSSLWKSIMFETPYFLNFAVQMLILFLNVPVKLTLLTLSITLFDKYNITEDNGYKEQIKI